MSLRRPSKSLLDDLEHFAEEQEASERLDSDDIYDSGDASDDNDFFDEDEVDEDFEYDDAGNYISGDELNDDHNEVGDNAESDSEMEDQLGPSMLSSNQSLGPLYEVSEDFSNKDGGTPSTAFSLASAPAAVGGSSSTLLVGEMPRQERRSTVSGKSETATDIPMSPSNKRDAHSSFRATRTSFISSSPRKSSITPPSRGSDTQRQSLAQAAGLLGSADTNSQWENVAAAAAVVAASTQAPGKRTTVQFGQGNYVLVMLTLLNITSPEDSPKDSYTVDPVNRFGYPRNEGHSDAERRGPYSYVMCRVQQVHFEEDQRYYTVLRLDSETEQRAEPSWMEPLRSGPMGDSYERALLAAQRTVKTMAGQETTPKTESKGLGVKLNQFIQTNLIPFYTRSRASLKKFMQDLLHGNEGYAIPVRCTGVNLLVLCSSIYLFIDLIALAYLPTSLDNVVAVIAITVWCILSLELFFEYLIRPGSYFDLIQSDKAFAPSTARHINRFHLFFEICSLILFLPSIGCSFTSSYCPDNIWFNHIDAALHAVKGINRWTASWSRFSLGLVFLRSFCMLRHWKQMWIASTPESFFLRRMLMADRERLSKIKARLLKKRKVKDEDDNTENSANEEEDENGAGKSNKNDKQLKGAATVGTALTVVNSHRALILGLVVITVFPLIHTMGTQNSVVVEYMDLLEANNLAAPTNSTEDCSYLLGAVSSWLLTTSLSPISDSVLTGSDSHLLWAQVLPVRCDFQYPDGVITVCPSSTNWDETVETCRLWDKVRPPDPESATKTFFADTLSVRKSEIVILERSALSSASGRMEEFYIQAVFDESHTSALAHQSLFLLVLVMLLLTLFGLSVMQGDADRLVLGPLQRMLKIVVKYADDPLSQTASSATKESGGEEEELGNYETEQLINAITKIADLLRKCWGVAGAGIISSNLARTKTGETVVFNPTVPGKRVYALFGFVAINDFGMQLRALDEDVMRLINDVARVVHDEVYRWSLGDSGECNKNLGAAFLMVFRIGDVSEVHDKKRRATDVVFNSQMKKNIRMRKRHLAGTSSAKRRPSSRQFDVKDGKMSLASLPGIQNFADRALLGMLKSFAGIHRDRDLVNWQQDFRLGAGVGAFKVNVIYGMDAGWGVEGAVGSEYKIDATYLSPHVNMASRMMSACKQYGVTALLSQAVEELLSKTARRKLRHLDTVYVKGSSVPQRIYTYDARYDGVDFFLFERSPEQADLEADSYTSSIWETDQDLRSMRQHVTDEFVTKFHDGVELYLEGRWKEAVDTLQDADDMMLKTVLEEGYVDYKADDMGGVVFDREVTNEDAERIRTEFGDGPCKSLVQYMKRRKCVPPSDWHGVRQLMSK